MHPTYPPTPPFCNHTTLHVGKSNTCYLVLLYDVAKVCEMHTFDQQHDNENKVARQPTHRVNVRPFHCADAI